MVGGIKTPTNIFSAITDPCPNRETEGYCESCLKVGVKSTLQKVMYDGSNSNLDDPDQIKPIIDAAIDSDKFRQCYRCGDIVPVYEVKYEPELADFVETSNNPFDSIKSNKMEVLNQSASQVIADKRNPIKRKYKQRRDAISSIKDDEIRRLLEKGAELIYQNES